MEFELKARSLNLLHRTANGDGELPLTTPFIILPSQPKHESALMHGCAVRREKVIALMQGIYATHFLVGKDHMSDSQPSKKS